MKIIIIVLNVIFVLVFFISLVSLIPTMMMFDSPESTKSHYTIFTALSLFLLPVIILIAQVGSWWLFAKGNYRSSLWWSLLPLVPIACAALGFLLIEVFQGGKFTPK